MDLDECDVPGCTICKVEGQLPIKAYRPHFMTDQCWCCFSKLNIRIRPECYIAKQFRTGVNPDQNP